MAQLPPEYPIEVYITTTKALWFNMIFVAGKQGRVVETTTYMWDIGILLDWLKDIAQDKPYCFMEVDREGFIDTVAITKLGDKRCHLRILDGYEDTPSEEREIYLDAVVSRRKLVWGFYYELQKNALALGHHYVEEKRIIDPEWLRLPVVEQWLDWKNHNNSLTFYDDVVGIERYGDIE